LHHLSSNYVVSSYKYLKVNVKREADGLKKRGMEFPPAFLMFFLSGCFCCPLSWRRRGPLLFPILPNEETRGRLGKVKDAREWDALKIDLK
jgi:hypothetical protein